jgi:hypothetical protein
VPNTYRYNNSIWAKKMTPAEFPQFGCEFWVTYMSGYGGISVAMFPNGATFYIFSDHYEYYWGAAAIEANKLAPICVSPHWLHREAGARTRAPAAVDDSAAVERPRFR